MSLFVLVFPFIDVMRKNSYLHGSNLCDFYRRKEEEIFKHHFWPILTALLLKFKGRLFILSVKMNCKNTRSTLDRTAMSFSNKQSFG